jgi:hypothetical protein
MSKRKVVRHRLERHHRLPSSRGGTNHPSNISMVKRTEHQAFHHLFGNMVASEVASMMTDTWIDSEYYFVAIPRKKKKPKPKRQRMYCVDCQAEVLKHIPKTEKPS